MAAASPALMRFCAIARADALSVGLGVLQNAHLSPIPRSCPAIVQPSQTFFMQQILTNECSPTGKGIGSVQIGQKSPSGLSRPCCPYSRSSFSSAARLLHAFLCCLRWALWQSTLQYLTRRHAVHFFNTTAPASRCAPALTWQFAQTSARIGDRVGLFVMSTNAIAANLVV